MDGNPQLIRSVELTDGRGSRGGSYDLAIAAVGYERRCWHGASTGELEARHKVGCVYPSEGILNFDENARRFERAGWDLRSAAQQGDMDTWIENVLLLLPANTDASIAVDVSSFDRYRLASIVWAIARDRRIGRISLTLVYSPARFNPPSAEPVPLLHLGPVRPEFAGWSRHPEWPVELFLGLGYERGRAVAIPELLEPGVTWLYMPVGSDERYVKELRDANTPLLSSVPQAQHVPYRIADPELLVRDLSSAVASAGNGSRPVVVTLGPKIFAACALLVACARFPEVAVWRASPGDAADPAPASADGSVVRLDAELAWKSSTAVMGGAAKEVTL